MRSDQGTGEQSRRAATTKGLSSVARTVKAAVESAAGRRGIAEARLISHWPEIVGPSIAAACRPLKVRFQRTDKGVDPQSGVLVLAVDGASATELEYLAPQILQKVNAGYGYGAIAELAFTQAHGPLPKLDGEELAKQARVEDLEPDKRARLEAMTRPVEDDALRDALTRLGANVMNRKR